MNNDQEHRMARLRMELSGTVAQSKKTAIDLQNVMAKLRQQESEIAQLKQQLMELQSKAKGWVTK